VKLARALPIAIEKKVVELEAYTKPEKAKQNPNYSRKSKERKVLLFFLSFIVVVVDLAAASSLLL